MESHWTGILRGDVDSKRALGNQIVLSFHGDSELLNHWLIIFSDNSTISRLEHKVQRKLVPVLSQGVRGQGLLVQRGRVVHGQLGKQCSWPSDLHNRNDF